jgi:hypothetical protein
MEYRRLGVFKRVHVNDLGVEAFRIDLEQVQTGEGITRKKRIKANAIDFCLPNIFLYGGNDIAVFKDVFEVKGSHPFGPGREIFAFENIEFRFGVFFCDCRVDQFQTVVMTMKLGQFPECFRLRLHEHTFPGIAIDEFVQRVAVPAVKGPDLDKRKITRIGFCSEVSIDHMVEGDPEVVYVLCKLDRSVFSAPDIISQFASDIFK